MARSCYFFASLLLLSGIAIVLGRRRKRVKGKRKAKREDGKKGGGRERKEQIGDRWLEKGGRGEEGVLVRRWE